MLLLLLLMLLLFFLSFRITNGPEIDIKDSFFINMDKSVERRESFLKQFPFQVSRIPGVIIDKKGRLGKGATGCLVAHTNVLRIVAQKEEGWYLICEDDARGPFEEIGANKYVRHLASSKLFINLSKKASRPAYSSWTPYDCTFAYLITPKGARIALQLIQDLDFSYAIDAILKNGFKTRLLGGNGLGAHVNLIWQEGESEIERIGR